MDPHLHATYEANKREMFDGMRAYHDSEIRHANHAITIIMAIAGAGAAVAAAMLFADRPSKHVEAIAWGLFAMVLVFSGTIALTTHLKISSDHAVFARFGAEYRRTSRMLGLFEAVTIDGKPDRVKVDREIGRGTGYRRTQAVIWLLAALVSSFALAFALSARNLVG
jgi:hypothetical protein